MNMSNSLFLRNFCVAVIPAICATQVLAQNSIQAVTASVVNGVDTVRVELSQPLSAVPQGFSIQSPARIAVDFPNTISLTGSETIPLSVGNAQEAKVVQAGDRTRLVLNLGEAAPYTAKIEGNSLLLSVSGGAAAAVSSSGATPSVFQAVTSTQPAASGAPDSVQDLDFRRGEDGAGRVIIRLPSQQVGVDLEKQGDRIVVNIPKVRLPSSLARKLDVLDFGTPVKGLQAYQTGEGARVVIEPVGDWQHSAYQSNNQFVVEVREREIDPDKLSPGVGYTGEKLSLNFQNIEIRSLLQVIADFTEFNIVTSDSVAGELTLRLQDVPWDQALDIILEAKGLGVKKTGNVLWVAPKEEIRAKEKAELEARKEIQGLEPLKNQSFQLNYTKADDIVNSIKDSGQSTGGRGGQSSGSLLSDRGSIIAEKRTNQIFVTDIPSKLEAIQELITKLDVPVRQVLIEARIVEAVDSFGKSLGVRLGGADLRTIRGGDTGYGIGGGNRIGFGTNFDVTSTQAGVLENKEFSLSERTFVNLPATGQGGYDAASIGISLFNAAANRFLMLELSALEADGLGRVVSSPRVVTADQTKAIIEQGTELPYQTATSSGATSVEFRKANLKLEVTPQITPEGNVIMDVDVNKDTVGRATAAGFAIDTKHVQTQVLVDNGGTVVIGGIFEITENNEETKVPFLGDLPAVGRLFRTKSRTSNKRELLVFITPKIIKDAKTFK